MLKYILAYLGTSESLFKKKQKQKTVVIKKKNPLFVWG